MEWSNFLGILYNAGPLVVSILFSALIGYLFGTAKSFREQKQKAYGEILPPIIRTAYNPQSGNESEFSQALMKLWLYGSKNVT